MENVTNEKAMTIYSMRTRNKILINPIGPFIRSIVENELKGIIKTNHDKYGFRYRIEFPDTPYGASIIKRWGSYGVENDNFEVAVVLDGQLNYDTPITDDVLANVEEDELIDILKRIKNLAIPTTSIME